MKFCRYIFLFLGMAACVDPLNLKSESQVYLVVDAEISDRTQPATVRLYNSLQLTDPIGKATNVAGAKVTITGDDGKSATLSETTSGTYQSSAIHGVVGVTYTLKIVTAGGSTYQSTPEKIVANGGFSNLRYDFEEPQNPDNGLPFNTTNGFNVLLDANLTPEQNGLVRWRWTGTFEYITYPEMQTKIMVTKQGTILYVPDPPICSGYKPQGSTVEQTGKCTCCDCWATQTNDLPLLSDPAQVTGNQIKSFSVAFIPATKRFFYNKYYLSIEQMTASRNVYDFWTKVRQQLEKGSDLFNTPPAATTGNIMSMTENSPPVVGIFNAYSSSIQTITLYRRNVPYVMPPIDTIKMSCLVVYQTASNVKPVFW